MDLPFRIETRDSFRVIGYSIQTINRKGEGEKPFLYTGQNKEAWI